MKKNPTVELKLPILKDMELVATHTSDVVAKHMNLPEEKSAEVSMALIEACINAFEHSETKEDIFIHFIISDENLTIKVIDKGVGFDSSSIKLPNIEEKEIANASEMFKVDKPFESLWMYQVTNEAMVDNIMMRELE